MKLNEDEVSLVQCFLLESLQERRNREGQYTDASKRLDEIELAFAQRIADAYPKFSGSIYFQNKFQKLSDNIT